jgi:hypothetical protein
MRGERLLVFAALRETVEMRAGGVQDTLDRQIESLVKGREAGQASRGIGQAVIAAEPRDHLLLLRPAKQIIVIAHQLEVGVVGVGARSAEEHLGEMPGARLFAEEAQHAVGESDDRLVRVRAEGMVIAQVPHRLRRRFAKLGAAVADIDAPQPGAAIDQFPAVPVLDPDPGAPGNYRRAVLEVIGDRGRRVDQALPIHFLERIILCGA